MGADCIMGDDFSKYCDLISSGNSTNSTCGILCSLKSILFSRSSFSVTGFIPFSFSLLFTYDANPFLGPTINFSLLHSNTWCFARNPLIFPSLSTFNSPTIDVSAYFTSIPLNGLGIPFFPLILNLWNFQRK